MKSHRNAGLSLKGRELLVERVLGQSWLLTDAAEAAGVSQRTGSKWLARYRAEGSEGLMDRSSAPKSSPARVPDERVQVIASLRRLRMTGAEIAECLAMPLSTVSGILTRIGMGKLGRLGLEPAVRYERSRPGELIHIDVKKLGRIERGAGHRITGREHRQRNPRKRDGAGVDRYTVGWEYVHIAIDDATRLAYAEVLDDEKATTAVAFLRRDHVLPPTRDHRRAADHRQRLPIRLVRPRDRLPSARHPTSTNTPLPTANQRQSRTLHPHDPRRLGLRRDLPRQHRTHTSP
jgi:transposase